MMYERKTKAAELAERYRNELLAARVPKDSPVMSGRELAEHFGISTVTANRVLNLLVAEDVLYRKPKSGTFIKHDPPVIPSIAYAGPLPEPGNIDPIRNAATQRLLDHFAELGLTAKLIPYHTFRNPALAERELQDTNGLLIHNSFIDDNTMKTLWKYTGRIVMTGNTYIDDRFPCSQVIPDFTEALREFNVFRPFAGFAKIILVEAQHLNSKASSESSRRILRSFGLDKEKVELISFAATNSFDAYLEANRYFLRHSSLPENTLIITLSEYFARGIRSAWADRKDQPDILCFDNMEEYSGIPEKDRFFTSIDRQMSEIMCRALDLLHDQLSSPGREQTILRIPAKLVIRKSVNAKANRTKKHTNNIINRRRTP
ncbi:MAG: LacI family DNA-binding transcriptional regulator [Lentisphaeria bacterium]|nr:LacI family DNA-binding transcriptional regulator [Lentisphaeria bacterium]